MTHVVTDVCIRCKYMECVPACPVDAFHEGMNMLVINPAVCIDCGLCVPVCPIGAIESDHTAQGEAWVSHNHTYAQTWPVIRTPGVPPQDAHAFEELEEKIHYFDPNPPHPPLVEE